MIGKMQKISNVTLFRVAQPVSKMKAVDEKHETPRTNSINIPESVMNGREVGQRTSETIMIRQILRGLE